MGRMCEVNQKMGVAEGKRVPAKRNSPCKTGRETLAKETGSLAGLEQHVRRGWHDATENGLVNHVWKFRFYLEVSGWINNATSIT